MISKASDGSSTELACMSQVELQRRKVNILLDRALQKNNSREVMYDKTQK